jgi:hypothetical protein
MTSRDGSRKFLVAGASFALGAALALCVTEPYYRLVWNRSGIGNMLSAIRDFSSVSSYSTKPGIKDLVKNARAFLSANVFLYNPALFVAGLVSFVSVLPAVKGRKGRLAAFVLAGILGLFLQTLLSNDYIVRKSIVAYPYYLLCVVLALYCGSDLRSLFRLQDGRGNRAAQRALVAAAAALVAALQLYLVHYRLYRAKDHTDLDFETADRIILLGAFAVCLILIALAAAILLTRTGRSKAASGGLVFMTLALSLAPGLLVSMRHVYLSHTYTEKQVMIDLGRIVGRDYVFGEYENGYSLYNDMRPILNTSLRLGAYMASDKARYYFDYYFEGAEARSYFYTGPMAVSKYTFVPIREFKRNFKTFGKARSVALYQKEAKAIPWTEIKGYISGDRKMLAESLEVGAK